jgi:hypothetical protein
MREAFEIATLVLMCFLIALYVFFTNKRIKKLEQDYRTLSLGYGAAYELIVTETNRREQHAKALKRLTDPEAIADEMEKGARMREMYDANRITLPREDAGPPAKVYSPKLRAKVPRSNYKRTKD